MDIKLEAKSQNQIQKSPVVQQTAYWSKLKQKQGIESGAFDLKIEREQLFHSNKKGEFVEDDLLILYHNVGNGHKMAYIPYGPTITPAEDQQGVFLEELSETVRPYLHPDCIALRYDLLWESFWAQDESYYTAEDSWEGPPAKEKQELRFNFNTVKWNLRKANSNNLPSDTLFIDLRKSSETLLKEMKAKTRYNIRLAQRKGVSVRKADIAEIEIWNTLYLETCARNNIFLDDLSYFKTVLATRADNTLSPVDVELLVAEAEGTPLAAMFLVYSGKRASYLYGASSTKMRNYMPTYALQWEAIQRAKLRGCTEYDMFGVSPKPDKSHPLYGLYKFKTGFGGHIFHRLGCWDYPLQKQEYELYKSVEMNSQGYHL